MSRRNSCLFAACLLLGACAVDARDAAGNFPPPAHLPEEGRWEPIPDLCDEFEGRQLDPARWHPRNPQWKGRQPGLFHPDNVTVRDGMLHITMRHQDLEGLPEGYHTYTCGAVKSKTTVRYGYFEARCRAMDSRGSSAFWFYDGRPETWTEIDVFEMGAGHPEHEHTVHMNAHVFHTLVNPDRHWSKGGKWKAPWRLADEFHVYALHWTPQELRYLVDGKVVRSMENTHWHQPLTLNFDSETMPRWFGLPSPDSLPSTFSIDYIRSWRRVDAEAQARPRWTTFRFPQAEARAAAGTTRRYRLSTDGEGTLVVVARFGRDARPGRVHLEYDHPAFFAAQSGPTAHQRIVLRDKDGKPANVAIRWVKASEEKRHGGYRADTIQITPPEPAEPGSRLTYDVAAEGGEAVRMTLIY